MPDRGSRSQCRVVAILLLLPLVWNVAVAAQEGSGEDRLREIQERMVATKLEKVARPYHFGSQGRNDVFSNHTSHSNRLIPIYIFGNKADLGAVTGSRSRYRTEAGVRSLYGRVPEGTINPEAEYADQSDLYRVQQEAVVRGAKYLFTIWFDGMDWETTRAAAVARTGRDYEGQGSGLLFQDYAGAGPIQFGYYATSPTHADPRDKQLDVDAQTVADLSARMKGGYDARFGGPNPWTVGPLLSLAPGYFKGHNATVSEICDVRAAGGVPHAYTDSSCSAAEYASGVKSYNNGLNVAPDGRFVPTLYNSLQSQGWRVGTVTSVPFDHASPAAMYAHNVYRDDYQDIGREMLGLESIVQQRGKSPALPGLDVVIGCGWGARASESDLKKQGSNAVAGNTYVTEADLKSIADRYVIAQRTAGQNGAEALLAAAEQARHESKRLFGFYGIAAGHLPYQTADGRFDPPKGIGGVAERYQPADLVENPNLTQITQAALKVLDAEPGRPFALFVEAGDVDFALHDNNLDNAIGAVYSGEAALRVVFDWVEQHQAWNEAVVIVTADHGHYLVLDDPSALAGATSPARPVASEGGRADSPGHPDTINSR